MALALFMGWLNWSLLHNLGHRFWHWAIKRGQNTFYTKGEKNHHRLYDHDIWKLEDPLGSHLQFPYDVVVPVLAPFVFLYTFLTGPITGLIFALSIYGCMFFDDYVHKCAHLKPNMKGLFGMMQRNHLEHHRKHYTNFSFGTGAIWDVIFGSKYVKH